MSLRIYQDKQQQSSNKNTSQSQIGGIIMLSFCLIVSICLLSGGAIFGSLGVFLKNFFEGVFGIASYALSLSGCIFGVLLISKRHITSGRKYIKASVVLFCALVLTVHLATTVALLQSSNMYGDYLSACFDTSGGASGGGVLSAVVMYPLAKAIGSVGSYIILGLIMFICLMVLTNFSLFLLFGGARNKPLSQEKNTPIKINPSNFYYIKNKNSERSASQRSSDGNVDIIGAGGGSGAAGYASSGAASGGADLYYTKPNKNEAQPKPPNKSVDILYNNRKFFGQSGENSAGGAGGAGGREKAKSMLFNKPGQPYTNSIYDENEINESGFNTFPVTGQSYTSSFEKDSFFGGMSGAGGAAGGNAVNKNAGGYDYFKNKPYNFSGLPGENSERRIPSRPPIVFHSNAEEIQNNVLSKNAYPANTPEGDFLANTFGKGVLKKNRNTKPVLNEDDELPPIIDGDEYAKQRLQSDAEKKLIKFPPLVDNYGNTKLKSIENIKPPQIDILDVMPIPSVEKARKIESSPIERIERIERIEEQETIEGIGDIIEAKEPVIFKPMTSRSKTRPEQIGFQISQEAKEHEFENKRIVRHSRYNAPPVELLDDVEVDPSIYEEDYAKNARVLEQALSEFKISATVTDIVCGPTVTRYELEMAPGIPVKRVISIADDIAMRLAATSGVRIEAPIPGKNLFGIEVPNTKRAVVSLKSIIESQEFKSNKHLLSFALGKDIGGSNIVQDLSDMPHLLIAGSTNTGKSVCLNSLIISLLYRYSPDDLRLILVDPKQVEFGIYNDMPHMMLKDVVTATESAISAFKWLIDEMERRYMVFKNNHVQNIIAYNNSIDLSIYEKMPRIVLIVDELSDLMSFNKSEVEQRILRLAQKARAAGIHLVLATQRPSVDVLTGTIKANLPCRIALRVISINDSKTILDTGGPEKLIGKGDMLLKTGNMSEPLRLQGAFVSMKEVKAVVDYLKEHNESSYDKSIEEKILKSDDDTAEETDFPESDKLFVDALRLVIKNGQASISMLQRSFSLGYAKAGKIIDEMEKRRYITGFEGSKARQILITMEQFNEMFGADE